MKILKIGAIALLVIVLGFAGLVFYGLQNLDGLVKSTVERIGSDLTGTEVELAEVNIQLGKGLGELKGLTVANPEGYNTDMAMSLGSIRLDIDPASALEEVITIEEIVVDAAEITAEEIDLQRMNLAEIAEEAGDTTAARQTGPAPPEESDANLPRIRVERFEFKDSKLHLVSSRFGDRTVDFPSLTANNIGGEAGLPPKALGGALMQIVLNQAKERATAEMKDAARERISTEVNEEIESRLSDEEKDRLDSLRNAIGR